MEIEYPKGHRLRKAELLIRRQPRGIGEIKFLLFFFLNRQGNRLVRKSGFRIQKVDSLFKDRLPLKQNKMLVRWHVAPHGFAPVFSYRVKLKKHSPLL